MKSNLGESTFIAYRLPLTWIRVSGTRGEVTDTLPPLSAEAPAAERTERAPAPVVTGNMPPKDGVGEGDTQPAARPQSTTVNCTAVVTTEMGSDPTRLLELGIRAPQDGSSKQTWTLLPDGRLAGADMSTTRDAHAGFKEGLETAVFVLSAGAPLATAGGPIGWLALGAVAAASGVIAGSGFPGGDFIIAPTGRPSGDRNAPSPEPDVDPVSQEVHPRYVADHPEQAQGLANYRQAMAVGGHRHSACVRNVLHDVPGAVDRLADVERAMRSALIGATAAEGQYAVWLESKKVRTSVTVDERIRIDELPTEEEFAQWCLDGAKADGGAWRSWARILRTAVTVDLLPARLQPRANLQNDTTDDKGDRSQIPSKEDDAESGTFYYRPPRPATIKIWKLIPGSGESAAWNRARVDVKSIMVARPGNEQVIHSRGNGASKSLSAIFDESGALTKITSDDAALSEQRANDMSALIPGIGGALDSGGKLGAILKPRSLTDRAADLDAAKKLGLIEPPQQTDQQKALEAAQYQAQLAIAQQIASASSPPSFVVQLGGVL